MWLFVTPAKVTTRVRSDEPEPRADDLGRSTRDMTVNS